MPYINYTPSAMVKSPILLRIATYIALSFTHELMLLVNSPTVVTVTVQRIDPRTNLLHFMSINTFASPSRVGPLCGLLLPDLGLEALHGVVDEDGAPQEDLRVVDVLQLPHRHLQHALTLLLRPVPAKGDAFGRLLMPDYDNSDNLAYAC